MRRYAMIVTTLAAVLGSTCVRSVPKSTGIAPGTPHVSWVFMTGDRDNPDQDFVCQSYPRNDCVMQVSRHDAEVFSHVYFYYHGAGGETKYQGPIDIGFFQGSPESHVAPTNITVKKNESIANQSVTGIVTSTPGTYVVTFDLTATVMDMGRKQPIRESVEVAVR